MKIALLGDIALIGQFDVTHNEAAVQNVKAVREIVSDCDFVIGNLESPLTAKTHTSVCKGAYLRSDPRNISVLKQMGVTHVSLANNHTYDYETKGAGETMSVLHQNGIAYVGLCDEPVVLEKEGERAMLDGFCCYSANATRYGEKPGKIQLLTPQSLKRFLAKAEKAICVPIASVHFGVECLHYPAKEHIRLFRECADQTDFVLHGNHPHSMQGYEQRQGSLLCYALGNLCFDDVTETSIHAVSRFEGEKRKSYIVLLTVKDQKITFYEIITVSIDTNGKICRNDSTAAELKTYSETLAVSEEAVEAARTAEKKASPSAAKTVRFIADRLNRRYIGAFLNGQIHARKYKKVMSDYL